jgi:acyl-CoA dehydrogenase
MKVCAECMDLAGRVAIDRAMGLEKLFRDLKALDIIEGTGEIHRLVVARSLKPPNLETECT